MVNVKDFGAVGNGLADDTSAVKAAIEAAPAGGGAVFFPAGSYLLKDRLVVARKQLVLRCAYEGAGGGWMCRCVRHFKTERRGAGEGAQGRGRKGTRALPEFGPAACQRQISACSYYRLQYCQEAGAHAHVRTA